MNPFQEIFDKQKAYFDSDATKSYEWRIDQLTRLENLVNENSQALEDAMSSDFKTASQEKVFEIMAPVGTAAFAKAVLQLQSDTKAYEAFRLHSQAAAQRRVERPHNFCGSPVLRRPERTQNRSATRDQESPRNYRDR